MEFRTEQPGEYRAVENLVRKAFWNIYKPGCDEHLYLHQLRQSPVYLPQLSFTAWEDGKLVGQIACARSHVTWAQGGVLDTITFGPLAVLPEHQKQGVGLRLFSHALQQARTQGEAAALILGDPRYYGRLGFHCAERFDIALEGLGYLVGLLALELIPGSLRRGPGVFQDGFPFSYSAEQLDGFNAQFPPREKRVTAFQQEFQVMCSLHYTVTEDGYLQDRKGSAPDGSV